MGERRIGKFFIEIELGNDAMRSKRDVARALSEISSKLSLNKEYGIVMDVNGNSCGCWGFK